MNKLNLHIVFKVAWAGFMQLGEIIYTKAVKHYALFKNLHLTCFNITFSKNNQYTTLKLKWSKTDTTYTGVLAILADIGFTSCLWRALRTLLFMTLSRLPLHFLYIITSYLPDTI